MMLNSKSPECPKTRHLRRLTSITMICTWTVRSSLLTLLIPDVSTCSGPPYESRPLRHRLTTNSRFDLNLLHLMTNRQFLSPAVFLTLIFMTVIITADYFLLQSHWMPTKSFFHFSLSETSVSQLSTAAAHQPIRSTPKLWT
jgi:hypothetical protein